ncbi:MAG: hypothetical protein VKL59_01110 [Nostocaceae cyanobacterium]|nr:hypothetical protein [Nostocaceae cyanobacterium]
MSPDKQPELAPFHQQVLKAVELISFSESVDESQPKAFSSGFEESKKEAEEILARQDIKAILCPALKNITNDAYDLANAITPLLFGAVIAGTIVVPLNPVFFGWVAIVIAKAGAASLCQGYDTGNNS